MSPIPCNSDCTRYRIAVGITKEIRHNIADKQTPGFRKKFVIETNPSVVEKSKAASVVELSRRCVRVTWAGTE